MTDPDDPRVGDLLGRALSTPEEAACILVGFPVDEGVRRNAGRPGAAGGPDAIRRCLFRMTPDAENFDTFVQLLERTADLGNLPLTGEMEADQAALGDLLAPHLKRGATAVVLGGGHEMGYGHFLGYVGAGRRVRVLNWDAHADVRPLRDGRGHSGSPFRQIVLHESGACTGYTVMGLNPQSTALSHLQFLAQHGSRALFCDSLDAAVVVEVYDSLVDDTLVSFDLDALDQCAAPGVSAPNASGLTPSLWLHAAESAGRCRAVCSIDVAELNPEFDRDDQTARLAALTVWRFWRGRVRDRSTAISF
jgi:formiminoglutamase